jgi:hypothetical protein
MADKNSHHRILLGHLPHYYVTKRDDRLTRQEKQISTRGGSVRSILSYVVVEELATGGAHVELYPHTTAESGPSVLLALTYAWSSDKCEPRLSPIGVPSTLWVEEHVLRPPEGPYDDDYTEDARDIRAVCESLGVKVEPYHQSGSPFSPVRSQRYVETLLERAFSCVDGLMAHNNQFEDYRVSLAHACGVWLGLHGQVEGCVHRKGTPDSFNDEMAIATRPLPSTWYERAGTHFKGDKRKSEAGWKALRPDTFWDVKEA